MGRGRRRTADIQWREGIPSSGATPQPKWAAAAASAGGPSELRRGGIRWMIFARAIPPQCSRTSRTRRRSFAAFWWRDVLGGEVKNVVDDTAVLRAGTSPPGGGAGFAGRRQERRVGYEHR